MGEVGAVFADPSVDLPPHQPPHIHSQVRGYKEEGTITTPFDMTVPNDLGRFHLVMDSIDRLPQTGQRTTKRVAHKRYIEAHGQDLPEIRDWTRSAAAAPPGDNR